MPKKDIEYAKNLLAAYAQYQATEQEKIAENKKIIGAEKALDQYTSFKNSVMLNNSQENLQKEAIELLNDSANDIITNAYDEYFKNKEPEGNTDEEKLTYMKGKLAGIINDGVMLSDREIQQESIDTVGIMLDFIVNNASTDINEINKIKSGAVEENSQALKQRMENNPSSFLMYARFELKEYSTTYNNKDFTNSSLSNIYKKFNSDLENFLNGKLDISKLNIPKRKSEKFLYLSHIKNIIQNNPSDSKEQLADKVAIILPLKEEFNIIKDIIEGIKESENMDHLLTIRNKLIDKGIIGTKPGSNELVRSKELMFFNGSIDDLLKKTSYDRKLTDEKLKDLKEGFVKNYIDSICAVSNLHSFRHDSRQKDFLKKQLQQNKLWQFRDTMSEQTFNLLEKTSKKLTIDVSGNRFNEASLYFLEQTLEQLKQLSDADINSKNFCEILGDSENPKAAIEKCIHEIEGKIDLFRPNAEKDIINREKDRLYHEIDSYDKQRNRGIAIAVVGIAILGISFLPQIAIAATALLSIGAVLGGLGILVSVGLEYQKSVAKQNISLLDPIPKMDPVNVKSRHSSEINRGNLEIRYTEVNPVKNPIVEENKNDGNQTTTRKTI